MSLSSQYIQNISHQQNTITLSFSRGKRKAFFKCHVEIKLVLLTETQLLLSHRNIFSSKIHQGLSSLSTINVRSTIQARKPD